MYQDFCKGCSISVLTLSLLLANRVEAQGLTKLDLAHQSQDVNFTGAASTSPFALGPTLPSTCNVGQAFFTLSAPYFYLCVSQNVWTTAAGSSIVGGPSGALNCGDGQCDIVTAIVPRLPAGNVWTGANDFSMGTFLRITSGPGVPTTGCTSPADVAKLFMRNDAEITGASFYGCTQTGVGIYSWELMQASNGSNPNAVSKIRATSRDLLVYDNIGATLPPPHMVRGSVLGNTTVTLKGRAIFSSETSYVCTADGPASISYVSGSTFSINTVSHSRVRYVCSGE